MRDILNDWAAEIGPDKLRDRLTLLDPEAADGIDGPNLRRMVRALEVIFTTGEKFSAQKNRSGSTYRVLQIGLIRPREELYQRIDERVEKMLQAGLVDEVSGLLAAGYAPDSSAMSAIGYKQIADHLSGLFPLDEAVRRIKSKTHKYVRQQANWFKTGDPNIRWFSASNDPFEEISDEIQHFLS
jgi:tRNA dimethylallyltransferase